MSPAMSPRRARPEDTMQRAICQHLDVRGVPGLVWFHVPQGNKLGGKRSVKGIAIQGAINRSLGVKRGVSDLIFLHAGKFFALELKAEGRTPTAEQLEFIDKVNALPAASAVGVRVSTQHSRVWKRGDF